MCVAKETEHLQGILVMVCICTFLVCHLEMLPKHHHFCILSREAMLQSGTGFKSNKLQKMSSKRKMASQFIIEGTQIKIGSESFWLWIAIGPKTQAILRTKISKGRNMFVYRITLVHGPQQILFDVKVESCCSVIVRDYLFKRLKVWIVFR